MRSADVSSWTGFVLFSSKSDDAIVRLRSHRRHDVENLESIRDGEDSVI